MYVPNNLKLSHAPSCLSLGCEGRHYDLWIANTISNYHNWSAIGACVRACVCVHVHVFVCVTLCAWTYVYVYVYTYIMHMYCMIVVCSYMIVPFCVSLMKCVMDHPPSNYKPLQVSNATNQPDNYGNSTTKYMVTDCPPSSDSYEPLWASTAVDQTESNKDCGGVLNHLLEINYIRVIDGTAHSCSWPKPSNIRCTSYKEEIRCRVPSSQQLNWSLLRLRLKLLLLIPAKSLFNCTFHF